MRSRRFDLYVNRQTAVVRRSRHQVRSTEAPPPPPRDSRAPREPPSQPHLHGRLSRPGASPARRSIESLVFFTRPGGDFHGSLPAGLLPQRGTFSPGVAEGGARVEKVITGGLMDWFFGGERGLR